VFLRELDSGALTQLTRTEATESQPMFLADGRVAWLADGTWWLHDPARGVTGPAALLKFEKDPEAEPEPDLLRDMQLRLFPTLAREKTEREAKRAQDRARQAADPTRAPRPFYLGADRE